MLPSILARKPTGQGLQTRVLVLVKVTAQRLEECMMRTFWQCALVPTLERPEHRIGEGSL